MEERNFLIMAIGIVSLFVGMIFYIDTLPTKAYDDTFKKELDVYAIHEKQKNESLNVFEINESVEIESSTETQIMSKENEQVCMDSGNKNKIHAYTIFSTETVSIDDYDNLCRVVMNEAGGESFKCQVAVAETIINRVNSEHFPNTIDMVLNQPYQYSHYENGEVTDSVKEAVQQALEKSTFDNNMVFFREDYFFCFEEAEDYFDVDNMYFSLYKE